MLNEILFATSMYEDSDDAARIAFNMASNYNSHLSIFHVMGIPTKGFSRFILDIKTNTQVEISDNNTWVEKIEHYYSDKLEKVKSYEIKTSVGYPYREILRFARIKNPDIIILGDDLFRKRDITESTVYRVTKLSTCPVLLVNHSTTSFWKKASNVILVSDFSEKPGAISQTTLEIIKKLGYNFNIFEINFNTISPIGTEIKESEAIYGRYLQNIKANDLGSNFINAWGGRSYTEAIKYAHNNKTDLIIITLKKPLKVDNYNLESSIEEIFASNCFIL